MLLTESELVGWGVAVGREIETPAFLCLAGELGAGKSVLARAIARGAGVLGTIPSPTFNLLLRYRGNGDREVIHLDLYRLTDPEELWELGWEELGGEDQLVLVEWPERAGPYLPPDRWEIRLDPVAGSPALRKVEVTGVGEPPWLPPFRPAPEAGRASR